MEAMVEEVTGVKVLSLHHDISTATGEEVVLFTLATQPPFRESKKIAHSHRALTYRMKRWLFTRPGAIREWMDEAALCRRERFLPVGFKHHDLRS